MVVPGVLQEVVESTTLLLLNLSLDERMYFNLRYSFTFTSLSAS